MNQYRFWTKPAAKRLFDEKAASGLSLSECADQPESSDFGTDYKDGIDKDGMRHLRVQVTILNWRRLIVHVVWESAVGPCFVNSQCVLGRERDRLSCPARPRDYDRLTTTRQLYEKEI